MYYSMRRVKICMVKYSAKSNSTFIPNKLTFYCILIYITETLYQHICWVISMAYWKKNRYHFNILHSIVMWTHETSRNSSLFRKLLTVTMHSHDLPACHQYCGMRLWKSLPKVCHVHSPVTLVFPGRLPLWKSRCCWLLKGAMEGF